MQESRIVTSWSAKLDTANPDTATLELSLKEFFEEAPLYKPFVVKGLYIFHGTIAPFTVELRLHCESELCDGTRTFSKLNFETLDVGGPQGTVVTFVCRDCQQAYKRYALIAWGGSAYATAMKIGELPPPGPAIPTRLITLVGPDQHLLFKGRRAESQGMGIGAFAYYRRLVENQKGRLISEIARVAKRMGADAPVMDLFASAAKETQFKKAVDSIKDSIPASLLIDGHNPLNLLHSALSKQIHDGDDDEALEMASDIRIVLTRLAENIDLALKNEAEVKNAVARLLQSK